MSENINYDFDRKIVLKNSKLHGRGIFATADIKAGDLVERCPLVILAHRMNYHKDPTIWSYMFTNSCPCNECKNHGGHFLMVMGYAQIYNHQDNNNAAISFNLKDQYAEIHALKDIAKGKEIFINYGPQYFKNRPKITLDEDGNQIDSPKALGTEELDGSCTSQVFKPL